MPAGAGRYRQEVFTFETSDHRRRCVIDLGILKSLIPLVLAAGAITVALVKVKSKGEQTAQDATALRKDVDRLEKDAHDTTQLKAQMIQVEKNISTLWSAVNDMSTEQKRAEANLIGKIERLRDILDERANALRDKINGAK
jgi:septal ring factor EnvC (AmiA/AmiB activator)